VVSPQISDIRLELRGVLDERIETKRAQGLPFKQPKNTEVSKIGRSVDSDAEIVITYPGSLVPPRRTRAGYAPSESLPRRVQQVVQHAPLGGVVHALAETLSL
jgi:hypothetical protein